MNRFDGWRVRPGAPVRGHSALYGAARDRSRARLRYALGPLRLPARPIRRCCFPAAPHGAPRSPISRAKGSTATSGPYPWLSHPDCRAPGDGVEALDSLEVEDRAPGVRRRGRVDRNGEGGPPRPLVVAESARGSVRAPRAARRGRRCSASRRSRSLVVPGMHDLVAELEVILVHRPAGGHVSAYSTSLLNLIQCFAKDGRRRLPRTVITPLWYPNSGS